MAFANAKIMEQLALMRQLIAEDEEKKLIEKFELLVKQTKRGFYVSLKIEPHKIRVGFISPFSFSVVIGLASIYSIPDIFLSCFSAYRDYRISMLPIALDDLHRISSGSNLAL